MKKGFTGRLREKKKLTNIKLLNINKMGETKMPKEIDKKGVINQGFITEQETVKRDKRKVKTTIEKADFFFPGD